MGAGLLVLLALLVSERSNNRGAPSASTTLTTDIQADGTGAPRLAVSASTIDHGDVQYGTVVLSEFEIQNMGNQPLMILDDPLVEVVKGCCPPKAEVSQSEIDPGQQANLTLHFTMDEGMGGPHEFRVHLKTNDPQEPEKELVVLSNWVAGSPLPSLNIDLAPSFDAQPRFFQPDDAHEVECPVNNDEQDPAR